MNKRLLILADPFTKPSFAPRLRYLCNYLAAQGWSLDVYTEKFASIPFEHAYPIHEVTLYHGKWDWFWKAAWSLLTDWKDRAFARKVRRLIQGKEYDAVFCTTFSTFPLGAALALAEERGLPLHLDIRDLDEQVPGDQYMQHRSLWTRPFRAWYRRVNRCRRNRVLRQAHSITTISPWHVDFIRPINPRVHLVYNGFDPDRFYPADVKTGHFLISYIGRIYEFQDIDPVRQAVQQLNNPEIRLNLHTPDHAPLPIHAVPDEIRRSSIMVVLTDPSAKGMLTTKFFEALGCEKPVLCYPDDHGILSETIRRTHAGTTADDVEHIKAFILEKYAEWQRNGFTRQTVQQDEKNAFSRLQEAQMMEELLCS